MAARTLVCAFGIAAAMSQAQTSSPITREGSYWVQTVTGDVPINGSGRLRVTTVGNITLHGGAPEKITYSLKKRVRADNAAEAERAVRDLDLKATRRGAWTYLNLTLSRRRTYSAELSLTAPRNLTQIVLETRGGSVNATDFDGQLSADTSGGHIELDRLRSNVTAKTGGGEIRAGRVDGTLHCYSGGGTIHVNSTGQETWLNTAGGDIFVQDAFAPIHVATGGGNIRVDRSTAEIFARTAAGVIEVGQAGGQVTAETSGGAIQVNSARGVRCESTAGTIRLRNMEGAVRAMTAQGSILAQLLAGHRIEDSILSTVLGDITVSLPSNIPVTIQARNESAGSRRGIISEFREVRVRNAAWDSVDPLVAEGTLNGGGPVLRIVTSNGVIFLRRQK
jgi:DUF4097 and DUF4098 domain-containing protein YvlB